MRWFIVKQSLFILLFLSLSRVAFAVTINPVTSPTLQAEQTLSGTVEPEASGISIIVKQSEPVHINTAPETTWSYTITGLTEGENLISVAAVDADGNLLSSAETTIILDTSAPGVPAVTGATPSNDASPTWSWNPAGGGNGTYRYKLDGSDLGSGATESTQTSFTPASALSEGSHTLYVQERDAAGNWSGSGSFAILVDITAPTAVVGGAPAVFSPQTGATLTVGGAEVVAYKYKLDSGTFSVSETPAATKIVLASLQEGAHTVAVIARDSAGNWQAESSASTAHWTVDSKVPVVSAVGDKTTNAPFTQSATVTDATSLSYAWSKEAGPGTIVFGTPSASSTTISAGAEGTYLLRLTATDAAGNAGYSEMTLIWDVTKPAVDAGADQTRNTVFTQSATVTDTGALSYQWTKQSGPGEIIFGTPDARATTVSAGADGSYTLRLTATDAAGNTAYGEMTLIWDTLPPDTGITAQPATPSNIKTGSFSFTSPDATAGFECSLDGAPYAACSSPKAFDFGAADDGNHSFKVRGKDPAGNIDQSPAEYSWSIDTAAPGVPTVTGMTPSNDATPTWSWNPAGGGNGSYRYKLDGSDLGSGATQSTQASFTPASALSEGSHTLYVQERDAAGNWSGSGSFAILIDVTAPTAVLSGAPATFSAQTGATLTVGGAEVVAYKYKLDSGTFSVSETPATTKIALASLQEGAHTVAVIARDSAGNWQTESSASTASWTVDSKVPVVSAGGNKTANAAFTQTATATDATALSYAWSKQAGPGTIVFGTPAARTTTVSANADGSYTLRFTATDAAGNAAYQEMTLVWDTLPPDTGITAQPANPSNLKTGSFSFTSPDATAGFECSLDGAPYAACISPKAFDFGAADDGNHSFKVRGKDPAGNIDQSPAEYSWSIDTAAPGVPTVTGMTPTNNTKPTWSWSPAGGGSGSYRYKLDGSDLGSGATQSTQASFTPASALSEGSHTLYVQERDAAGNWSGSGSFAILVDVTAPTAVLSGAPATFSSQTGATLTVGGVEVMAYKYRLDSGAFSAGEIPAATKIVLASLPEGAHSVAVIARDSAGNWQAESSASTASWTVDSKVPVVSAGGNKTANAAFTQTATATDATALSYAWSKQAGPGAIVFGTPTARTTTVSAGADGSYTLRFTATDAAGNTAYQEMMLLWDTLPPTLDAAASFADASHVDVSFSETVVGADAPASYQADNGLTVTGAALVSGTTYRLTTSLQTAGTPYTITAGNNIADPAGNVVRSGADTASFTRPLSSNRAPGIPTLNTPTNGTPNLNEVATLSPTFKVNASTDSDGDPITYSFEVSAASDFGTLAASKSGVTATGGSASWTADPPLSDNTTYYWRTLANDGYVNSAYMPTGTFFVNTANESPAGAAVSAPADGTDVASLTPTLTVSNATDVDRDTLSYEFAVAIDSGFANLVASAANIAAKDSGSTSWTVPSGILNDNTLYYWRSRANDQHGTPGNWATASFFSNTANDAPSAPTPGAPVNGTFNDHEVTTLTPTLVCNNAGDPDRDALSYVFEIAALNTFSGPTRQASLAIAGGSGTTSWTPAPLSDNTTWYWRVKANDGRTDGPWMTTGTFFVNTANNAPATPTVQNPADNSRVASLTPALDLNAAADLDHDPLSYEFAVFSDIGLSSATKVAGATGQTTRWSADPPLQNLKSYYWTARAKDIHNDYSPWTQAKSFFIDDDGVNGPPVITISAPGPDEAPINAYGSAGYTVSWSATDADSNPVITLYYDTSSSGYTGTRIATGIRKDDPAFYSWDTSSLPDGTYYIYAGIADEATSVFSSYAGPIVIDRTPPASPVLSGNTPSKSMPTWNWRTGGGGSGTYRYKLDGSDLGSGATESTQASFTPASALSEGSHTLFVQERDAAGNWSGSGSFAILVDVTAPTAVLSGAPAGFSAQTGATLTVGGAEVVAYKYRLDSGAFSAGEIPAATKIALGSLQEGAHNVAVIARDSAGNWQAESSASTASWTVDSKVPVVSAGGDKTANAAFTQSATATDATSLSYAWSKEAGPGAIVFGTPAAPATTVSADADGSYTLRFTATDAAGNTAYQEMTLLWDTLPPETGITAQPANPSNLKSGSFSFTSPHATASFECSMDSAPYAACSSPKAFDFGTADDGGHTFEVRGKDPAGNIDQSPAKYAWSIDTAAPGVPTVAGITPTKDTTPTWSWRPAGGGSGSYRYKLDGSDLGSGATQSTDASFTPASALSEGSHTLYVQERDAAGNWSNSGSFAILVDITAPSAVVSGAPAAFSAQTGANLTVDGAEVVAYKYKLDSGTFSDSEISVVTMIALRSLPEGTHTVAVIARDNAGNWQAESSASTASWTVDSKMPEVSAGGDKTANATFTQAATATDATSLSYAWSKQAGPGAIVFGTPSTRITTVSASADGSYTLRLTATDAAGNTAYSEMTLVWDVTKPAVYAGATQIKNAAFTQSATVTDANALSYQWTKQSGPGTIIFGTPTASGTTISADAEGSYLLRLTATDAAGNAAYSEMTLIWDVTRPAVDAGADQTTNAVFTQSATATDVNALSYQWTKESGPGNIVFGTPSTPSTTVSADADGSYTLRLTATDAASNTAYSETTLLWDTLPPTLETDASFADSSHVDVSFSETVVGADAPASYQADNGLTVTGAAFVRGTTYRLTTSLQTAGTPYTITAGNNIADPAGNAVGSGADTASFVRPLSSNRAPGIPTLDTPTNGTPNLNEVATLSPTFKVDASTDSDGDPVTYSFEVSATSDFGTLATSKSGVRAIEGSASWTADPPLSDNTTYYWRTLANDGYVNSAYMPTGTFFVNTANEAPAEAAVSAPADGTEAATLTPTLTVSNATDADRDTLSYEFAVATDSGFANIVASAAHIAASDSGSTSWTVPSGILNDNTLYYWRSRANDQHETPGNWATASFFSNTANDAPSTPTLDAPVNGTFNDHEVTTLTPTLVCNNAGDPDRDALSYVFEIAALNTFSGPTRQASPAIAEGSGTTSWTPAPLSDNTTWYWRVKANDGRTDGPWMTTGTFFVNVANNAPATPTVQNPADNSRVATRGPALVLNAAADLDHDPLSYEFAVFSDISLSPATQVAGATEQTTSWSVDPPLENLRSYYWTARAKDIHNYYSPWTPAKSFFIDDDGVNEPPAITITAPGPSEAPINAYGSAGYTVSWHAVDPDSNPVITLYYDTSSSGYAGTLIATGIRNNDPAFYSWDTSALPDGAYYIYAGIADQSTSVFSSYAGPIVIDRTPPASPVLSGNTPSKSTTPTWSWQTGGGGSGSYRYKLDGSDLGSGATQTTQGSFTPAAALPQGSHTLYVQEQDPAGNWSAAGTLAIQIDTAAPSVTGAASSSASGAYKPGSAIDVTVNFSEPVSSSGLVFTLNSGAFVSTGELTRVSSYSGTYNVAAGEESTALNISSVTGTIADAAGNATDNPAIPAGKNLVDSKTVIVDTTAPVVHAGTNKISNAFFTQSATASDSYPMKYAWVKEAGPGEIVFGTPNALSTAVSASKDGTYQLRFAATDSAGNSSSSDMTLVWDTSAPTAASATSTSGSGSYRAGSSVNITVNFSEPVNSSGLILSLSSGATLATGTLTGAGSFSGSYLVADEENSAALRIAGITGIMTDAAGNTTGNPVIPEGQNLDHSKAIAIDTGAPDTAYLNTPPNPSNSKSGNFSFGSADLTASFECSTDQAGYAPCASPFGFDFSALPDGGHSFSVRARDPAGNLDPSPAVYSWVITTSAPTASVSGAPQGPTNSRSASLIVGGTDVAAYKYKVDAGSYSSETPVATTIQLSSLGEGAHTVWVVGRDNAGNWQAEADASAVNWIVDVTPPLFQEVSTLPDGSFTNKNELNIAGIVSDAQGVPTLRIEVAAGSLYTDTIPVDQAGGYSYLLKEKLNQGVNSIKLVASDPAGNQSVDARSISYDPGAPKITINTPADNSTSGRSFLEVAGTADEQVGSVEVQVFDCRQSPVLRSSQLASLTAAGFSATSILSAGCNTIVVVAKDLAGNEGSDKRSVTFDDQKPTLAVTEPGADLRTQVSVMTVKGTVADALSAVAVTVNSNSESFTPALDNGAFSQEVRFTQNTVYHIQVKATDAGNNEALVQRNVIYAKPANGDINKDGRLDILDCLIALRISLGLLQQTDNDLLYGDVAPLINGAPVSDGVIDVGDATVILKAVVGLISLP